MKRIARWARQFGIARAVCLALLFGLVPLRIADPRLLQEVRLRTFDHFQVLRPREQTVRPVVIVDINEESLKQIGQWPWPRTILADLVDRLTDMGAVAIGFDAVFAEPDQLSPNLVALTLRDLDDATRARLRSLPSNDEIFAAAIRRSRVVLGESVSDSRSDDVAIEGSGYGVITTKGAPDARTFLVSFPSLVTNIPILEKAAAGAGVFTEADERDGIVRRAPVIMHAGNAFVPSLALEMLRVATNSNSPVIRSDKNGIQGVSFSRFRLPTDREGRLWIYFNHTDPERYVSARDVLHGRVPDDRIRGKLVLIGTSAIGLLDLRTTPLDSVIPGVEVHAQVIENVLTNTLLSAPSWAIGAEIVTALVLGLAIIIAAPLLPAAIVVALGASVDRGPHRHVVVLLCRPQSADRLHLSADVELADLSGAHVRELLPRTAATPSDPLGVRVLPVAAAGRTIGEISGKAGARRRRTPHDHSVQRRARLHHYLRALQGRSAGSHSPDESFPHAADQRHHRA